MRVDEAGTNHTTFGVDLFVYRLRIVLTDEINAMTIKYNRTVFDDFMFVAVKADDESTLDESFHRQQLSKLAVQGRR